MRIIFLGTPEFSVASLQAIVEAGFNIVAVVTAPDKPAGRGLHLQQSPVKQFALGQGIPVLQPEKLKNPEFIRELKGYQADLQVVIAFRMLPREVWGMPPLGTVNLHASLLPDYRGAAPINHVIINGETETGVCTFFLKHEIDTGDIITQEKVTITPTMTAGELHDLLKEAGARLIVKTLHAIENHSYTLIPQPADTGKTAPRIFTEDCRIHWEKPGHQVYNLVRGLSPYPGAFTLVDGKTLKIYGSRFIPDPNHGKPGTLNTDHRSFLRFACADGWIEVTDIQLQGKKRMPVTEFLKGFRPPAGMA